MITITEKKHHQFISRSAQNLNFHDNLSINYVAHVHEYEILFLTPFIVLS